MGEEGDEGKCRNDMNKGSETTSDVWSYSEGASLYGAYQMSGNVWEWCEDWYEKEAYDRYKLGDLKPPGSGQCRVVRGGSGECDDPDPFTASPRGSFTPGARDPDFGFRCVWVLGDSP